MYNIALETPYDNPNNKFASAQNYKKYKYNLAQNSIGLRTMTTIKPFEQQIE
jgi:hypothetical protein